MTRYGIKITYPNGDEDDDLYGNFSSKEEAFKEICVLAAKEAYVQNEDFDELKTCSVYQTERKNTPSSIGSEMNSIFCSSKT